MRYINITFKVVQIPWLDRNTEHGSSLARVAKLLCCFCKYFVKDISIDSPSSGFSAVKPSPANFPHCQILFYKLIAFPKNILSDVGVIVEETPFKTEQKLNKTEFGGQSYYTAISF